MDMIFVTTNFQCRTIVRFTYCCQIRIEFLFDFNWQAPLIFHLEFGLHAGACRRYAEFFDGLPVPLFRTTIEGKIIYCNYAFADLFGFDSALDLIDYPVIEFYQHKKDRGNLIHTVMQTGRISDLPVALKKKDGTAISAYGIEI